MAQVGVPARQGGWTYKALSVPEAERRGAACAGGRGGPQPSARSRTGLGGHCPRIGLLRAPASVYPSAFGEIPAGERQEEKGVSGQGRFPVVLTFQLLSACWL